MTTEKKLENLQVYFDERGPGWFATAGYSDGTKKRLDLRDEERDDWTIDDAISTACWSLGLMLEPHDFAIEDDVYAVYGASTACNALEG